MDYLDKTVWITGASSGIGEALAKGATARGASVILSGRRVEALKVLAAELETTSLILPFEATNLDALPYVTERAIAWRGGVDLLINNAGVSQRSLALDTEFEVYRKIMEIDFFGPVRLTGLILPHMVERRSGHLAVISSIAGKVGVPLRTGYCAAKHAVIGYFDALRAEVEETYGLGVTVITPGAVATQIAVNAFAGDGGAYGMPDANVDGGMSAERAAKIILDGIGAGRREIPIAEGDELNIMNLRASDPERAFAVLAALGTRLAAARGQ